MADERKTQRGLETVQCSAVSSAYKWDQFLVIFSDCTVFLDSQFCLLIDAALVNLNLNLLVRNMAV